MRKILILVILALSYSPLIAQKKPNPKISVIDKTKWIDVNNLDLQVNNQGILGHIYTTGVPYSNGLFFPSGQTEKSLLFNMWLSVAAQDVSTGNVLASNQYLPGQIKPDGSVSDYTDEKHRVYKVSQGDGTENPDFAEFPCELGAPCNFDGTPKILGDQMLWCVYNDINENIVKNNISSDEGLGLEIRQTVFAFNSEPTLANTIFMKYQLFNKGDKHLKNVHTSFFYETAIGSSIVDDLEGVIPDLNLVYSYNANNIDDDYSEIPALGFKQLQGPIVEAVGSTAKAFGKTINNYRNIPLNSSHSIYGGTLYNPETIYFYMQGLDAFGNPKINPLTGETTKFDFAGNPITQEGNYQTYDRGLLAMFATGGFDMAPGDSQEVIFALVVGQCESNLLSLSEVFSNSKKIQRFFDDNYSYQKPPKSPKVNLVAANGKISFDWYTDKDSVENYDGGENYNFEGYSVYQGESKEGLWHLVQRFDLLNGITVMPKGVLNCGFNEELMISQDTGLNYSLVVEKDILTGKPLEKWKEYHFAVTSYAIRTGTYASVLESPKIPIELTLQSNSIGTDYSVVSIDSIRHISGKATGDVSVEIIHESEITGDEYELTFGVVDSSFSGRKFYGYQIENITKDSLLIGELIPLEEKFLYEEQFNFPVIEGLKVKIYDSLFKLRSWKEEGVRWVTGVNSIGSQFFGGAGLGLYFSGSDLQDNDLKPVRIEFHNDESKWSDVTVYKRDLDFPYKKYAGIGKFPGMAFDVSDSLNPRRINICIAEDSTNGNSNLFWDMGLIKEDGTLHTDSTAPENGGRESIYIMDSDYNGGIDYNDENQGFRSDVQVVIWAKIRESLIEHPYQEGDFALTFYPNHAFSEADTFRFKTTKPIIENEELAKSELSEITPVPNPYYGRSEYENGNEIVIRFVNLPDTKKTTIRIFNLSGDLVTTLKKDSNTGNRFLDWNGTNKNGSKCASGVYIYHIQIEGLGDKTGKMICAFRR